MKITDLGSTPSVTLNERGDIVINCPWIDSYEEGSGDVRLSSEQAKELADLLNRFAIQSDQNAREKAEADRRKAAEAIVLMRKMAVAEICKAWKSKTELKDARNE